MPKKPKPTHAPRPHGRKITSEPLCNTRDAEPELGKTISCRACISALEARPQLYAFLRRREYTVATEPAQTGSMTELERVERDRVKRKGRKADPRQIDMWGGSAPYAAGRETSQEAAESMESSAPTLRKKVFGFIKRNGKRGATCDEVEIELSMSHQTASPRVYELHMRGLIKDGLARRKTRSGRNAIVWVVG